MSLDSGYVDFAGLPTNTILIAYFCGIFEGLGPILGIYDERFHLRNQVIKFS